MALSDEHRLARVQAICVEVRITVGTRGKAIEKWRDTVEARTEGIEEWYYSRTDGIEKEHEGGRSKSWYICENLGKVWSFGQLRFVFHEWLLISLISIRVIISINIKQNKFAVYRRFCNAGKCSDLCFTSSPYLVGYQLEWFGLRLVSKLDICSACWSKMRSSMFHC